MKTSFIDKGNYYIGSSEKESSPDFNTNVSSVITKISAYMLNASGELTTGDIAGIMGTIEPDSYGRSSPSTVYDINGACYIIATGYPTDVGYSIPNSYGIFYAKKISTFALRTSATTTVRIV